MRRRSGEALVIGEERLGDEVLPFDDGGERGDVEPGVDEPPSAAEVRAGVGARIRQFVSERRRFQMALGGGALLALGGAWLAVGVGNPGEAPSSPASEPAGAVPLLGDRHPARQVGRPAPGGAGAMRPGRGSGGRAAGAGGAESEHDAEAPVPTPTASAPAAAPPTSPGPAMPTESADPAPAEPTPASAATVQREFGP